VTGDAAGVPTALQQDLADELWEADRTAVPVSPLTDRYPDLVLSDAYTGQLVFSGGVTAPVPFAAGGSVTFEFDGLGVIDVYGA
jgi:2-keto-4-pentenoate hydratase